MPATSFAKPLDNATGKVAAAYTAGSATLTLADASSFGTPSPSDWLRLTVARVNAQREQVARVHLKITGIAGNALTVAGTLDGYAAIDLLPDDIAYVSGNKGTFLDIQGAINTLEVTGGPPGFQGSRGYQGFQGGIGQAGPQGYQGIPGFPGSTGSQGPQGSQGQSITGSQGVPGTQGPQGSAGNQGSSGSQGPTGVGSTGPQGYQGSTGPQGYQGNQGFQGYQGFQGNQGFQGFQGYQGNQGATGTGTQGYQGASGSGGSATPAGSNTQFQYNNSGSFGGATTVYNSSTGQVGIGNGTIASTGVLTVCSTTQGSSLLITGKGLASSSPTNTSDGVGIYLNYNDPSSTNTQMLMGSVAGVGNTSDIMFRLVFLGHQFLAPKAIIDAVDGTGSNRKDMYFGTDTSNLGFGVNIANNIPSYAKSYTELEYNKGVVIRGATSQTTALSAWQDSTGTTLTSISPNGALTLTATMSDSNAPNNSLFRGSDHSGSLCWKNNSGTVSVIAS